MINRKYAKQAYSRRETPILINRRKSMNYQSVSWKSKSGKRFIFEVYDYYSLWEDIGGIYIFSKCKDQINNIWVPIYIGQTSSFKQRLRENSHEKWFHASRLGAHAVLATVERLQLKRMATEFELIQEFDPVLNEKLKPKLPHIKPGLLQIIQKPLR